MNTQEFWPNSTVDASADLYVLCDHMPHTDITGCSSKTYPELENELFGGNTYLRTFKDSGIDTTKKFFVSATYIYLDKFTGQDNVVFLPIWNFYLEAKSSKSKANVIDFDKKTTGANCQMHNQRYNRILASCWIYNNKNWLDVDYTQSWASEEKETLLFELLKIGKLATWQGSDYAIKNLDKKYINSDVKHSIDLYFENQQYNSMFRQSAVSVVLGSTFFEYGCDVDEKYLTAVFGGTIPIHDGYGFYDTVKKLGFDTFDDIVDTSGQYESNPCTRTWNTLEKNRELLMHGLDYIKQFDIQERILNNYNLARNPDKILLNAFKNLNTVQAQSTYLEKYQEHVINSVPGWPAIEL